MLRRVFTMLSGLSLLLCAAAAMLWVRSYFRGDLVGFAGGPPRRRSRRNPAAQGRRPLPQVRPRPPRHARPLPGVRRGDYFPRRFGGFTCSTLIGLS
jgi:hypothetical protein